MKNIKNKKIILFSIITIILVVAICLVILFIGNKQKSDNNIENQTEVNEEVNENVNNTNDEDLTDDIDYNALKNLINEASIMYVFDNYSFMENTITEEISLSVLVDNNYIEDETILKLYNDGVCDAYSIVTANSVEIDGNTYLKCENYMTEGYDYSHLKKDSIVDSNSDIPIDSSNNQDPNENSKIVVVEDYTGKNYKEVKNQLESLGLLVIVEIQNLPSGEDPNNYNKETIIGQSVASGSRLSVGDRITLYIPNIVTSYPNFCNGNYSVAEVQEFANSNNLNLTIEYVENSEYDAGTIIYQSRAEGTTVIEGARLKIRVSK